MTEMPSTLEPTFADAIKTITAATDLPEPPRRHWCSSLVGIARAFDQPPEAIPARLLTARPLSRFAEDLHHAREQFQRVCPRALKGVAPHDAPEAAAGRNAAHVFEQLVGAFRLATGENHDALAVECAS